MTNTSPIRCLLKPFSYVIYCLTSMCTFRYEVKVLDELETKVEPAVHELRLGWSTDDTDMQLGIQELYLHV